MSKKKSGEWERQEGGPGLVNGPPKDGCVSIFDTKSDEDSRQREHEGEINKEQVKERKEEEEEEEEEEDEKEEKRERKDTEQGEEGGEDEEDDYDDDEEEEEEDERYAEDGNGGDAAIEEGGEIAHDEYDGVASDSKGGESNSDDDGSKSEGSYASVMEASPGDSLSVHAKEGGRRQNGLGCIATSSASDTIVIASPLISIDRNAETLNITATATTASIPTPCANSTSNTAAFCQLVSPLHSGKRRHRPCQIWMRRVLPKEENKIIFLVRHGQSLWNKACVDRALHRMISQVDHPLDVVGIEQARQLAARWKKIASREAGGEYEQEFLRAEQVYSSPMTRALQTAIVSLRDHPCVRKQGIKLLPRVREIKRSFAMDTVGVARGKCVVERAFTLLNKTSPTPLGEMNALQSLIDTAEVQPVWWTRLGGLDSERDLKERMHDLLCRLRYSNAKTSILVGHSLFFREFLRKYLSHDFLSRQPTLAHQLRNHKLSNAGVLRLRLDWSSKQCISDAQLVFESKLEPPPQSSWVCGLD